MHVKIASHIVSYHRTGQVTALRQQLERRDWSVYRPRQCRCFILRCFILRQPKSKRCSLSACLQGTVIRSNIVSVSNRAIAATSRASNVHFNMRHDHTMDRTGTRACSASDHAFHTVLPTRPPCGIYLAPAKVCCQVWAIGVTRHVGRYSEWISIIVS